jgi:hypothetical protein
MTRTAWAPRPVGGTPRVPWSTTTPPPSARSQRPSRLDPPGRTGRAGNLPAGRQARFPRVARLRLDMSGLRRAFGKLPALQASYCDSRVVSSKSKVRPARRFRQEHAGRVFWGVAMKRLLQTFAIIIVWGMYTVAACLMIYFIATFFLPFLEAPVRTMEKLLVIMLICFSPHVVLTAWERCSSLLKSRFRR